MLQSQATLQNPRDRSPDNTGATKRKPDTPAVDRLLESNGDPWKAHLPSDSTSQSALSYGTPACSLASPRDGSNSNAGAASPLSPSPRTPQHVYEELEGILTNVWKEVISAERADLVHHPMLEKH
jgi:hypothetical protein